MKKIGGAGGLSAAGAADYYENEVRQAQAAKAQDEYLMADPTAPLARWWSPESRLVQDGASLQPGQLRTLLNGEGPDGKPLVRGMARGDRVVGWDLTFNCPKSASALFAAADPVTRKGIMEDVAASASAALRALHDLGAFETRRGYNGTVREPAHDVAVALFPQATSRAGDPQLHCHSVLVNAVVREDGTTGAIASQRLYFEKTFAGAVFRAELADRLARRGLGIEEDGAQQFRVAGVPKELTSKWSSRRKDVLADAGDAAHSADGKARREAKERAALRTRQAKAEVASGAELETRWRADMAGLGLSPSAVWEAARQASARVRKPDLAAGDAALDELLSKRAVVRERELRRVIAERTQARGGGAEAVRQEFARLLGSGRVLELAPDGQERVFSTREVLDRERRMILDARDRLAERSPISREAVERAIAARPSLSNEQAKAVRWIGEGGGVVIAEGVAGSGKSFSLAAVKAAAEESGARIIGLAPSWAAVDVLRKELALPSARALQGFVADLESGRLRFGDEPSGGGDRGVTHLGNRVVLLVDEASMAGSRDMAALLHHARQGHAQVVLIGDRKQLRAVEPGEPLAALADEIGLARMKAVRRQDDPDDGPWMRDASLAFSRGQAATALASYDKRNRIAWATDSQDAVRRLADAHEAHAASQPDASRLVLAHRNSDVHALNAALRDRAMQAGRLGSDALQFRALQPGGTNGAGEVRDMEIRAGDRVAIGISLKKSGRDVSNGDVAIVLGFTRDKDALLRLRLDRTGREVVLRLSELAPKPRGKHAENAPPREPRISHGYARSVHKSQGATCDVVFVYGGEGLDARLSYVAMTRHRKDALLVVDDGTIGTRLREEGAPSDMEDRKRAFFQWCERPGEGGNAADYIPDRERWLRTGDAGARKPLAAETGWGRTREVVKRATERAAEAVREVARRAKQAMQRSGQAAQQSPSHQAQQRSRGRGMTI